MLRLSAPFWTRAIRYGYSFERDNPVRLLPRLKKRLLIVHERSDDTTPYLESRRAAEQYGNVRLHTTEGLGHKRILADPAVVGRVVDYLKVSAEDAPAVHEDKRVEVAGP